MSNRTCPGCGAPLQSADPEGLGYIPEHVAANRKAVCRRCYRLEHYKDSRVQAFTDGQAAEATVGAALKQADLALLVVDVMDFEAALESSLLHQVKQDLWVAVNKADLLPPRTPVKEVARWVRERLAPWSVEPGKVHLLSATQASGAHALRRALEKHMAGSGRVALLGPTNAGKSTLLAQWIDGEVTKPTVSPIPGTTMGLVEHPLKGTQITVIDTPGVTVGGRLSDLLCPTCAGNLTPYQRLQSKLWRLRENDALILAGLGAMTVQGLTDRPGAALTFVPGRTIAHRTSAGRVEALLRGERNQWLQDICADCRQRIESSGWEQVEVELTEGEDLVFHGLGWISPRKTGMKAAVTLPAGARISTRPRLVGPKSRQR